MSKVIKLKKGLDIKLNGEAEKSVKSAGTMLYAMKPTDFPFLTPKLNVKVGDAVKAGDVLFMDKANPEIKFTSPVSGTVEAINRGERRKLLEVVVKADAQNQYVDFGKAEVVKLSKEEIISRLLNSGVWATLIQRPFGVVANPTVSPKAVFVSAFDSSPLAPDYEWTLKSEVKNLQTGVDCLKMLCGQNVNLGLKDGTTFDSVFSHLNNVDTHFYDGPHPAGNVGVHINHVDPINKGEYVWTVNIEDVAVIGRLFNEGRYDAHRTIALTGSEVKTPVYYTTYPGAQIESFTKGNLKGEKKERIISGNVLTGKKVEETGFLGFYDHQITVIPEGDDYEFLGWAMPGFGKFSATRLFPSFLCSKKKYSLNANFHGELRAFVVSEQYEKVLPMDIFPVYLLKAALASDIEKMEALGIYEVIPEDLALCEFVCTSKMPVQQILRNGIELMIKETN